jgi:class 3 adenylate cyclase/pimeloyl-ACP methyl ester carboxylesterase
VELPAVQYTQTRDGVTLGFVDIGSGPPLVLCETPIDALPQKLEHPGIRLLVPQHDEYRLVHYDGRGAGSSDRDVEDFSLDARVSDLDAVVERTGLATFSLLGVHSGSAIAIRYAARNPGRVTRLVLTDPYLRGREFYAGTRHGAARLMSDADFEFYARALAIAQGADTLELQDSLAAGVSRSWTPAGFARWSAAVEAVDVSLDVGAIECPTLIVDDGTTNARLVREVASAIPGSLLVSTGPLVLGSNQALVHMLRFLFGIERGAQAPGSGRSPGGFRTILFTDLAGHTPVMARLGDDKGRAVLREVERRTRQSIREHGGTEIKSMGDGFMASFASAQQAVECATGIQRAFTEPIDGEQLKVRIGINAGEPVAEDNDLFGASVIAAARIAARAEAGQVLVANVVRELVAGKGFLFHDTGEQVLRGLEEPVRLWELRLEGAGG